MGEEKPKDVRVRRRRSGLQEKRSHITKENASRIVSCLQTRVSSGFRTVAPRRQAFGAPTARRPRRPLWLPHASVSSTHPPSLGPSKGREKTDASRTRSISKPAVTRPLERRRRTASVSVVLSENRSIVGSGRAQSRGASVASTNSFAAQVPIFYTRSAV